MIGLSQQVLLLISSLAHLKQAECLIPSPFQNNGGIDKGFNILEKASKVVPQVSVVKTAKESWKFIWKRMMTELAPQDKTGSYTRPSYDFNGVLGKNEFPDVGGGRYHVYVGNPCPWCHRVRLAVALRRFTSDQIGMTTLVDDPVKASRGGWVFDSTNDKDPLGCSDLVSKYSATALFTKYAQRFLHHFFLILTERVV